MDGRTANETRDESFGNLGELLSYFLNITIPFLLFHLLNYCKRIFYAMDGWLDGWMDKWAN